MINADRRALRALTDSLLPIVPALLEQKSAACGHYLVFKCLHAVVPGRDFMRCDGLKRQGFAFPLPQLRAPAASSHFQHLSEPAVNSFNLLKWQ